jgi:glycosyltransferase involved in cell wall biosynthesis
MSNPRILFIMRDFVQAGAQRFQYEVIRALDKNRYDVDVLVPVALDNSGGMFPSEYYFPLVKKEVGRIYMMGDLSPVIATLVGALNRWKSHFKRTSLVQHLFDFILVRLNRELNMNLSSFLKRYDAVNLPEYDFCLIKHTGIETDRILTHVMTAKVQTYPDSQFKDYNPNARYTFLVDWDADYERNELSYFRNGYRIVRIPLVLRCSEYSPLPTAQFDGAIHIGIFTRLSPLKPLEPFIYALHLLRGRGHNVVLHIFGAVGKNGVSQLEYQRLKRNAHILQLKDNVVFEGHQEDMTRAAREKGLHVIWFQGFNGQLGGYAALEMMLTTVPHVFYDMEPYDLTREQELWPQPCFFDLERFVMFNERLIQDDAMRYNLGHAQRRFVLDHRDAEQYMPLLHAEFDRLAAKPR